MKKTLALMIALLFTFNITTYAAEGDIVDIAVNSEDFTVLVAALTQADLVGALQGEGPLTVFAPTDAAFTKLLASLEIEAADLLAHPQLSEVLLYHVVSGKVMSTDLSDNMTATTLKGEDITIGVGSSVTINTATVVTPDIEAVNGVIHIIDEVLVPSDFVLNPMEEEMDSPSIVEIALADEQFSMLVSLLQKADLVTALQGEGPFTVFAPTNAAFTDLLQALDITPEELMAQEDLAKVLLYHVVSGKVMSTDLSNGLSAPTLNGQAITFDLTDGVKANTSSVIAADIEASNGVVHVIDAILVPSDFMLREVNLTETQVPDTGVSSVLPLVIPLGSLGLAAFAFIKKKIQ